MVDGGLGQKKYKMSLGQSSFVPKSNVILTGWVKRTKKPTEQTPTDQIWHSLRIKRNTDYN